MTAGPGELPNRLLLPRSVRRAVDAMQSSAGRSWTVTELASVAGVSSRTLQRQFLAFLGKPPRAMLRDINFERARRELLRGSPGAKVMDIALCAGFQHCGRFSAEYRRRYGETPSQTLNRQALLAATLASAPAFFPISVRDWPIVAFGDIEAAAEHREIADHIVDDLALALPRAGIAIGRQPRSARYHLIGVIRGSGAQTRLLLRLVDNETGRQLWAHRSEDLSGDAAEENLAIRIAAALQPTLRLAEIPIFSMIRCARTLPTPGIDSSRADTFILPTTSSVCPSLRTAGRVVEPCLSRFLTSARSLRALAAFSRAAARCSGVSGGRATLRSPRVSYRKTRSARGN